MKFNTREILFWPKLTVDYYVWSNVLKYKDENHSPFDQGYHLYQVVLNYFNQVHCFYVLTSCVFHY